MINAIKYMDDLEQSGFTQDQAKISVNLWLELMNENFATKNDMHELRAEFKSDMQELRAEFKNDMNELRADMRKLSLEVRHEMKEMDTSIRSDFKLLEISLKSEIQKSTDKLTIKLGSIMALGVSLMLAIQIFK